MTFYIYCIKITIAAAFDGELFWLKITKKQTKEVLHLKYLKQL